MGSACRSLMAYPGGNSKASTHCVCLFGLMMVQMCVLGGVNTQNFHVLLLIKIQERPLNGRNISCGTHKVGIYIYDSP
ncbi:unnamed protein product [Brassica oleracea]